MVVLILTLLAHGCPIPAIVAAFFVDERTVTDWLQKAGQHGALIQEQVVCNGQVELGQVQADELTVKTQHDSVWMATAMCVFSRLFLWGEVARARNQRLIDRLIGKVRAAAGAVPQAVLFAIFHRTVECHFPCADAFSGAAHPQLGAEGGTAACRDVLGRRGLQLLYRS